MEGKLYKINNIYTLMVNDKMVASNDEDFQIDYAIKKLSLKNCQAIENGYDLDELYEKVVNSDFSDKYEDSVHYYSFIEGFQKALELLGNKKFSEDDVRKAIEFGMKSYHSWYDRNEDEFIQSLQQTEWDVEIEMVCPHPSDTYRCGMEYGCDADGCNHPNKVPYIDKDGCLILKRK